VHQTLLYNPEDRPTAAALLRHPFVANAMPEQTFLAELDAAVPDVAMEDVLGKSMRVVKAATDEVGNSAVPVPSGPTRGRVDSVAAELDMPMYKHLYAGVKAPGAGPDSPRRTGVSGRAGVTFGRGSTAGGPRVGASGSESRRSSGRILDAASIAIDKAMQHSASAAEVARVAAECLQVPAVG